MKRGLPALLLLASTLWAIGAAGAQVPLPGTPSQGGRGGIRGPVRDGAPASVGTASIRGRVVTADTGAPIRRAQVRAMSASARGARLASTDAQGRFELRDLPAGRWEVVAPKAGFVTLRLGQRRPFEGGTPIELTDGQALASADIALPRGAAITGRVFDEFGDPVAGARVRILRYQFQQGERRLVPSGGMDESDDTGAYRLFGLMPGDYYVSATLRSLPVDDPGGEAAGYAPTFFPGTGNVGDAQRVTVGIGQEVAGISFALLPVRTVQVSGTALDSSGQPLAGGLVQLGSRDATLADPLVGGRGGIRGDGSFVISNVAPGAYTLRVSSRAFGGRRGGGNIEAEAAFVPVTVGDSDLTGLSVSTSKGATVSGLLVAQTGRLPATGVFQVTAQAVGRGAMGPGAAGAARVDDKGAFTLTGLFGARLLRVNGLPQDWTLQSVTVDGRDVTDQPFELMPNQQLRDARIVLTNRVTEVTGSVTDGRQAIADYTAILFSDDPARWPYPSRYVRSARPDQRGSFRIRALPPGRYLAIAVDYLGEGETADAEVLDDLRSRASAVTLSEGDSRTIELRLVQRQ